MIGRFPSRVAVHYRLGCLPVGGLNRLLLKGEKKYVSVFKYVLEAVSCLKDRLACVCWLALHKDIASHTK